jgi:hypothetical protein
MEGGNMKELNPVELRQFIRTASEAEIIEYWRQVTAPKYGYTRLIEPKTGKVIATAGKGI